MKAILEKGSRIKDSFTLTLCRELYITRLATALHIGVIVAFNV